MTRAKKSFFNWITGVGGSVLTLILSFITRAVFIRALGDSYLGIEGLFTNILSFLSLAELGFGSAIVFKLYKPLETDDRPRLRALMRLYRRTYAAVGCVIAGLGLGLIPLLPALIKDYGTLAELHLNGVFIFLIYLFNSASSYWFFAYKTSFVQAAQRSYVLNLMGYGLKTASSLCQIAVLLLTHDFIVYLLVQIGFGILTNLLYAAVCDRRYPYLREKTGEKVSRQEFREFLKDCSALFLFQASTVVINASDNIVLSALLGLQAVGVYFKYTSVKVALLNLLYNFFSGVRASVGSLYTTGNLDWSRLIFRTISLCTTILFGVTAVGLAVLLNDFVALWLGPEHVLTVWTRADGTAVPSPLALLIAVELYLTGRAYCYGTFRSSMGLFRQMRFRPLINIVVNLAVSVAAVPRLGPVGCVVGTIVSYLVSNLLFDPVIICSRALQMPVSRYFLSNLAQDASVLCGGLASWQLCRLIPLGGVLGFIAHGAVCVAVTGGTLALCFFRTAEFRFLFRTAKSLLPGRKTSGEGQ